MPMRVCFVNSLYAPNELGGAERTVRQLAEGFVQRGHEVSIISLATNGCGSVSELNGVRTYYVPLANIYWPFFSPADRPSGWKRMLWHFIEAYNPLMTRRIGRILDNERPDVVSCHNLKGLSVGAWISARRLGLPLVQTLHDYFLACPNATMYKQQENCIGICTACRIFSWRRRRLSNLPDVVTSVSQRTLARLEALHFFNGVRLKRIIFGSNNAGSHPVFLPGRSPGDKLRLGYLGRIEQIKGLEVLLRAMSCLPQGLASLTVAGRCSDEEQASLLLLANEAEIRFIGHVDPRTLFSMIDFLVVPSVWEEPLGRVVHEAMAFGVPCIASDVGGIPEIVKEGSTGFLFEPGDVAGLAAVIERIFKLGEPSPRLRHECLRHSEQFEPNKILDAYSEAFSCALASCALDRQSAK